ncbi:hypothetical protein CERSUDRAFT_157667 [Gelatoporia subvermispora B]|uniref:Protein kinase domain-containing protein n=1 Tax=Ceriporiopsis subvermispora (strain B) TaxID=914234 RepID=M2PG59_CERS8|nr:hypothetical protein CERSUDRAFT_157667 [Gelatoporia subvermispora B]
MHKATQLFLDCEARESNSCPNLSPLHVSRNALAEMCHRMRLSTDKTAIDEATRCLQKTMLHTDSASCVQKLRSAGFVVLALPYPESLCASHGNYPIGVPSCSFEPGRLHRQNPSMFVVLLEHLKKTLPGITPADVVIVSSARHQTVEVAVKLGFQTALIRRPQHLESLVDLESAPPTYIADSMAHLCTVLCQRIPVPSRLKDPRDWRPDPFRVQEIYQDRGILAEGSGGKVYDAINVVTGENMVIKIDISEKVIQKECTLPYEAQAYRILRGHRGILEPRWSGHIGGGNEEAYAIVFEKLSPDLSKLCTFCRGRLSMKTICMLALQLIDIIEFVHSRGLIIRDIKPENCATGTDIDCSIVYMFDFGMAKLYQDPVTKKHIPYREGFIGTGTARYASHNAHFGRELSRRDDIEMLGHSLLYFYHDRLPWQGIYAQSTDDKLMRIGQMKTGKTFEDLLQRSPPELAAYFHHCRSLDFEDSPDYGYLKQQFTVRMKREGWQNDGKFDWIESSHSEDGTLLPEEYKWKEWPTS